jgi:hypothetical protein
MSNTPYFSGKTKNNSICVDDIYHPRFAKDVLQRLSDEFGGLPEYGILAGQSVASAVYELLDLPIKPIFNDLDCFVTESMCPSDKRFEFGIRKLCGKIKLSVSSPYNLITIDQFYSTPRGVLPYSIVYSLRKDKLNTIGFSVEQHHNVPMTNLVFSLIKAFDINAVQVGIDMDEKRLIFTPEFKDFLYQRELAISCYNSPVHTVIRLFNKSEALALPIKKGEIERLKVVIGFMQSAYKEQGREIGINGMMLAEKNTLKARSCQRLIEQFDVKNVPTVESSELTLATLVAKQFDREMLMRLNTFFSAFDDSKLTVMGVCEIVKLFETHDDNYISSLVEATRYSNYPVGSLHLCLTLMELPTIKHLNMRNQCIERAVKVFNKHPQLLDMIRKNKLSFSDILLSGKHAHWLEKNRHYLFIGEYETSKQNEALPKLHDPDFQTKIKPYMEKRYQELKSNNFIPRHHELMTLLTDNGLVAKELNSEYDFYMQGQQERHCVGGYYDRAKSGRLCIFALYDPTTGEHGTAQYNISISREDQSVEYNLIQLKAKMNAPVSQCMDNACQSKVCFREQIATNIVGRLNEQKEGLQADISWSHEIPF